MPRVFVCYRRHDTYDESRNLYHALTHVYDEENVFFDENTIPLAGDFRQKITEFIAGCDIVIVMIGSEWDYKLLHEADDYILFEITTALKCQKRLVVVTVNGAKPPNEADLPRAIIDIARIKVIPLIGENFKADFKKIKSVLESTGSSADAIYGNYIPKQSSDFLKWLENFLHKCKQHQEADFGIDQSFIDIIEKAKKQLDIADSVVIRAGETVANVQREYEKAELVAQEARKKLSQAEADLRKLQDDRTQAAYRALSEVHPLSEKLRNNGNVSDNKKKEFGIFGVFVPTFTPVEPPTSVQITRTKSGWLSKERRVDTLSWTDERNRPDTMYIIEVAKGRITGRGAVIWDDDKFYEIGRTSERTFSKEWSNSEKDAPFIYRVKSFFRGVESRYCDNIVSS